MSNLFKIIALDQYDFNEHKYADMYTVIINADEISSIEEYFPDDDENHVKTVFYKIIMNNEYSYITGDVDELKKYLDESNEYLDERLEEICGILAQIRDAIEKIG